MLLSLVCIGVSKKLFKKDEEVLFFFTLNVFATATLWIAATLALHVGTMAGIYGAMIILSLWGAFVAFVMHEEEKPVLAALPSCS